MNVPLRAPPPVFGQRADRILARFDRAAASYEGATPIQRQVAALLANQIFGLGLPNNAAVAELGCGVGYLAEATMPRLQPSLWVATDRSAAMVSHAARRLGSAPVTTAVTDASDPALSRRFDLVCSSLMLHWLPRPARSIHAWRRLVRPGGWLALTCPVQGTFAEWRSALARTGVEAPGPEFPALEVLRGWFAPGAVVVVTDFLDPHENALAFARAARAAGVDASSARALPAGVMRRALASFEASGARVTYRIAFVLEQVGSHTTRTSSESTQ